MTYSVNISCVSADQGIGEDNPLGHLIVSQRTETRPDTFHQKHRIALSDTSRHIPFPSHASSRHQAPASSDA